MKNVNKKKIFSTLHVVGFVLLAIFIILIVLSQREPKQMEEKTEAPTRVEELGEKAKKKILESLSAPQDASSQYTYEEKRQILESLSATQTPESALSKEEKKRILDSLSAPSQ